MKVMPLFPQHGFTLIELLTALLILALLALMSYRGLSAVLDTRKQITEETEKWRRVNAFFARFESDVALAAPRSVRSGAGSQPGWRSQSTEVLAPRLTMNRFAAVEGVDTPRQIAYRLNENQEIELWLWPGLDNAPDVLPARYVVLSGVSKLELQYMNANRNWVDSWPNTQFDAAIPQAVQLRIALNSGEKIMRVFAL